MEMLFFILIGTALPMMIAYKMAKDKNRSTTKALFVSFFFGWCAVVIIWLFLKTRDKKTGMLK